MRWGILSTARIARKLLAGAAAAPSAEVVAVASRDQRRADAYAREHGIPRAHGSYAALLADPEVDAVYNPLPNALHVEWTVRALEAGKHVLCEKPLSREPALVEAAFDAAEQAGRQLMEAFMWRHSPQTAELERLVHSGAAGTVRLIRAAFGFDLPDEDDVRWSGPLEGGALMDVGCYCVSALRLLGGEPERVSAELVEGGSGVDGRLAATLRLPGGVLGSFDCGLDVARRSVLEVVGDAATIVVPMPWQPLAPEIVVTRADGEVERITPEHADPYGIELEEFSQGRPRLGRADALGQARTIAALYRSAAEGRAVSP